MKTLYVIFTAFFSIMIVSGQVQPDLDSLQYNYKFINRQMDSIFRMYNPLLTEREILQRRVNDGIEIYLGCETDFSNRFRKYGNNREVDHADVYERLIVSIDQKHSVESQMVGEFADFLSWNRKSSPVFDEPDKKLLPENQLTELNLIIKCIDETNAAVQSLIAEFESCRLVCNYCNCERLLFQVYSTPCFTEYFRKQLNELLSTDEKNEFLDLYCQYCKEYLFRITGLKDKSYEYSDSIKRVASLIKPDFELISEQILTAMRQEAEQDFAPEKERIDDIEKYLEKEFGKIEYIMYLEDFQKSVSFMHNSLNPGLNMEELMMNLQPFLEAVLPEGGSGKRMQELCHMYLDNLNMLSYLITQYEEIPYFAFNAYPQYSNDIVNENIEIINSRINFEKEGLGYRTREFLELRELDLSNSNFSMDLLLKGHENIRKLDLSNTQVSSIENLVDVNLEWLDLSNTKIDQEDLIYLRNMETIEFLDLSNTRIRKLDINELCYYLKIKKKNCITRRKLENNADRSVISQNSNTSY